LSATPKRIYDEDGGNSLDLFFNDKEPYVFSYTMDDAIKNDVLCHYLYYPHIVKLNEIEFAEYAKISKQLARFFDQATGKYLSTEEVERLLLKRKRIIHKAQNKLSVFEQIVLEQFNKRGNLKYTLIYVPEGIEPDYAISDNTDEIYDDISLMNQFTKIVSRTDRSILIKQYMGNTPNREQLIKDYSNGVIHTLASMKCLDEGIDVPRSELAIFCASTGNPRQFIQRRGRVLRKHKDKIYAIIHDLVVIPDRMNDETTYSMEKSIIQKELERVVNFAELADNKTHTFEVFSEILELYNLNLNDLKQN
jgi:superfamily II DNA or RNA helicase